MILTCPSCHTRFALADEALTKGARKLRCAKCQHVWMVGEAVETPAIASEPEPALATPTPVFTKPPLPPTATFRMENVAAKLPRLPQRLAWSLIILLLLLIVGTFFFGRHALAERFPSLDSFYRAAGMIRPTAIESFDLQLTRAEKCLLSGRDMLCIVGTVTNKAEKPLPVPPIYVAALDKDGREFTDFEGHAILVWSPPPMTGKLLPGEARDFSITEPYPDKTITDFDYGFTDVDDE